MSKLFIMLIVCWVPAGDGTIKEAWHIERAVPLDVCLTMNRIFAQGGPSAVFTVRCAPEHDG